MGQRADTLVKSTERSEPSVGRKSGRKRRGLTAAIWAIVIAMVIGWLVYLIWAGGGLSILLEPDRLWARLGRPLLRTLIFISLGLLAGQLIEGLGWTTRLGRLVWPLINWARLPGAAGASFTSAFLSGILANTLLFTSFKEGRLNKRALVLTNLLNTTMPAYVLHMPTTMLVIISLTGRAGLTYVILTFIAMMLRFFVVVAVSRLIMPACPTCTYEAEEKKRPWKEVWIDTWPKFGTRIKRMVLIVTPVYLLVVLSAESGFFDWLRLVLTGWVSSAVVSVEAMGLIVFSVVAEFTSGFAAAGALLQSGALPLKQVVIALMIGNVAAHTGPDPASPVAQLHGYLHSGPGKRTFDDRPDCPGGQRRPGDRVVCLVVLRSRTRPDLTCVSRLVKLNPGSCFEYFQVEPKLSVDKKLALLRDILGHAESALVALSGGVDSSLLLHVCAEVLPGKTTALTVRSVLNPAGEMEAAQAAAMKAGVPHKVVGFRSAPNPIRQGKSPGPLLPLQGGHGRCFSGRSAQTGSIRGH